MSKNLNTTEIQQSVGVSRRSFLTGAALATVGAGAAGLFGCAPASGEPVKAAETGEPVVETKLAVSEFGVEYPWTAEPPAIAAEDIEEELDVDVAVIGLGVAGVAAFRAAAEAGAKTAAFEKGAEPGVRSSQYCYVNGTLTEQLGLAHMDEQMLIEDEWNQCAQMASYAIIRDFIRNQSDSFDWWVAGDSRMYIPQKGEVVGSAMGGTEEHPSSIHVMTDLSIDWENEPQAGYPTRVALTDHVGVVNENLQRGIEAGSEAYFGHFGEQLIMEDGRCVGVYVRNAETGKYKKVNARNGVVMAAGGCGSNPDMIRVFYPAMAENGNLSPWPNMDVEGNPTNTGDAYRMGYWAGAAFSQMMAPMTHVMGGPNDVADMGSSSGLTSPHLRLNYNGERFMNEDSNCSDCELAFDRQPQRKAFLIFDSHLEEQVGDCILDFPTTLAEMEERVDGKTVFKADTLEELFSSIEGMNVENALASVERYNELCASGTDEDFGKQKKYLFPVTDGPFYAQRMGIGLCLTTMGGLSSDEHAHVISTERKVIPGLYAAGNSQGDRFAVKYPFKLSGASHALALYYGMVAGQNAAAGE